MLIDLHVHSTHSPGGALSVRDVVRRARVVGLDGVVFTDLNTLDGLEEIRQVGREEQFVALCGVEISTDRGHYLCYFPDPSRFPAPPQLFGTTPWPVRDVVRTVVERGGVVVAAHPYDKTIDRPSGDFIFTLEGLSAIEGLNARCSGAANDLAVEAADHMNLPCIAGSGAHGSLDDLGRAATLLREPVTDEAGLVAQIRAGGVYCVTVGALPQPVSAGDGRPPRGPRRDRDERHPRGGDRRPHGDRRGGGDRRGPPRRRGR
jgi:predicted metal-dependent phosphoesterase TrpH